MTVTVFTCDGSALPSACTVTVPKQGRCRDLIQALSGASSLKHNEKLLLAEVSSYRHSSYSAYGSIHVFYFVNLIECGVLRYEII